MSVPLYDISLLLENMVLLLMKQTKKNQEQLIREIFQSKFYDSLIKTKIDINAITPEEAVSIFLTEGGGIDEV